LAITNGLITLDDYAQFLGFQTPNDPVKKADVEWAIEVASESIRQHCGRWFLAETSSARYYDSPNGTWLDIDDATAVTEVAVDTGGDNTFTVVDSSGYQLLPVGGRSPSLGAVPYNAILRINSVWPNGAYVTQFPNVAWYPNNTRRGRIRVTASWGWAALPEAIKRACAIYTQDLLRDKEASFGGILSTAEGVTIMSRMPRRVTDLCAPYRRIERVGTVIA
jgi:hypothetical protein